MYSIYMYNTVYFTMISYHIIRYPLIYSDFFIFSPYKRSLGTEYIERERKDYFIIIIIIIIMRYIYMSREK